MGQLVVMYMIDTDFRSQCRPSPVLVLLLLSPHSQNGIGRPEQARDGGRAHVHDVHADARGPRGGTAPQLPRRQHSLHERARGPGARRCVPRPSRRRALTVRRQEGPAAERGAATIRGQPRVARARARRGRRRARDQVLEARRRLHLALVLDLRPAPVRPARPSVHVAG